MKKIIKYLLTPIIALNLFLTFNLNATALETNHNSNYDTTTISCGNVQGIPRGITILSRNCVNVIKILVPVILVILGIIDMVRATTASDEKAMKEATSRLIKRIIAAVLVFFVVALIQFVIKLLANASSQTGNSEVNDTANNITKCISCFISDKNACKPDRFLDE